MCSPETLLECERSLAHLRIHRDVMQLTLEQAEADAYDIRMALARLEREIEALKHDKERRERA